MEEGMSTEAHDFPPIGEIVDGVSLWLASVPYAISQNVERHHLKIRIQINKFQTPNVEYQNGQRAKVFSTKTNFQIDLNCLDVDLGTA